MQMYPNMDWSLFNHGMHKTVKDVKVSGNSKKKNDNNVRNKFELII